jgi:AraC-like DNA-binding protein
MQNQAMKDLQHTQQSASDLGQSELAALIERHATTDGSQPTAIPSLYFNRSSMPSAPAHSIQEPALGLVAQGSKVVMLGSETFTYDPERFLMVSVGLPVSGRIVKASPECPFLGLRLDLDPALIAALIIKVGIPAAPDSNAGLGLSVGCLDVSLRDAMVRLIRLLEKPEHIPMLAPLVLREIHYLLLVGPEGGRLREIALMSGQTYRVARAIERIRQNYDQPLRIETIARETGMSASSLHHQFKAVTAMSPLQYQKQLRLQEARRLMLGEDLTAASACFRVGYESPSQFSREYRRLFGAPPGRDVARLRENVQVI